MEARELPEQWPWHAAAVRHMLATVVAVAFVVGVLVVAPALAGSVTQVLTVPPGVGGEQQGPFWVSPVLVSAAPFGAASLRPPTQGWLRLRARGGAWTPWHGAATPAPAAAPAVAAGSPVTFDELQVRLPSPDSPRGGLPVPVEVVLRLEARAETWGRKAPEGPRAPAAPLSVVLERPEWGGLPPLTPYTPQRPEAIVLHHSWSPTGKKYWGAATIAGIQRFHMFDPATLWDDVGYHYLIGPEGAVYRGRPEQVVGAHCVPNSGKIGICLIGNYDPEGEPLPDASWAAARALVLRLADRYDVPPDRLYGHRDFSPKTCPGERVYERLDELRTGLRTMGFRGEGPPARTVR